jgi:two-component system phosphate regulon sensor histidine kinase PhoR
VNFNRVKIVVLAGAIAFVGIIVLQIYLLRQAFDYEEKKFSQGIQVALLEVAGEINQYYGYPTPDVNPVEKVSRDYYVVNVRNDFEAKVLELLLKRKFEAKKIRTNFEYAIYDCETDAMLYGSYVQLDKESATKDLEPSFPKAKHLVYYFAVRFPDLNSFISADLSIWLLLSLVMFIALVVYLFAIRIILQQQKFASLQKDFINNMTHEFKTPLSSILIAGNYLARNDPETDMDKRQTYAQIIVSQGEKLNAHLEKVLKVARSDEHPELLDKRLFSLVDTVQRNLDLIRLKYPEAVVRFENEAGDCRIEADEFHVSNMVYNFLDNSIKYCSRKPEISIGLRRNGDATTLLVSDNGIGIPDKYLRAIFSKFFRVPDHEKTMVNGFGLGLYYVKKVCDLHGWKIAVSGNPAGGTTFTVNMT